MLLNALPIIILVLFFMDYALQVYACIPPLHIQLKIVTKILLIPLLILWLLLITEPTPWVVILALFFGFLGDVFLLEQDTNVTLFVIGCFCFGFGHIAYSAFYVQNIFKVIPLWLISLVAVPYLILMAVIVKKASTKAGSLMSVAMGIYYFIISIMSLSAFYLMMSHPAISTIIIYISSLIFLFSDYCLVYDRYIKHLKFRNIIIMSTYGIAQFGITFGIYLFLKG